jgi:hypothetical protein
MAGNTRTIISLFLFLAYKKQIEFQSGGPFLYLIHFLLLLVNEFYLHQSQPFPLIKTRVPLTSYVVPNAMLMSSNF